MSPHTRHEPAAPTGAEVYHVVRCDSGRAYPVSRPPEHPDDLADHVHAVRGDRVGLVDQVGGNQTKLGRVAAADGPTRLMTSPSQPHSTASSPGAGARHEMSTMSRSPSPIMSSMESPRARSTREAIGGGALVAQHGFGEAPAHDVRWFLPGDGAVAISISGIFASRAPAATGVCRQPR